MQYLLVALSTALMLTASVEQSDRLEASQTDKTEEGSISQDVTAEETVRIPRHRFSVRLSGAKSLACSSPDFPSVSLTLNSNKSSPATEVISIPVTGFSCKDRRPGYYADTEISCRVFHYCNGVESIISFFCPSCTLFDEERQLCDFWYNVQCGNGDAIMLR